MFDVRENLFAIGKTSLRILIKFKIYLDLEWSSAFVTLNLVYTFPLLSAFHTNLFYHTTNHESKVYNKFVGFDYIGT